MTTEQEQQRGVAASEQLLVMNHQIRQIEHHIAIARRRRRLAILSYFLGPVLLLLLYVLFWLPWFDAVTLTAICVPGFPLAIGFCVLAAFLSRNPGGPAGTLQDKKQGVKRKVSWNLSWPKRATAAS